MNKEVIVTIPDESQRELALDPRQSFIVQAPAGSGKTELLTRRFLTLLANVNQPEEILALTFTRKAASEMRHRIIHALQLAANQPEPSNPHELVTWQLARAALKADQQHNWQLINVPSRLRIQTLDALCATITQRMPLRAPASTQQTLVTDPTPYYRAATQTFLAQLINLDDCCGSALHTLLLYWDNQLEKLQNHLILLLTCRDQWLPYILAAEQSDDLRAYLTKSLCRISAENLQSIASLLAPDVAFELAELLRFSLSQRNIKNIQFETDTLPPATLQNYETWYALAEMLLTQTGQWRNQITKNIGFPAPSSSKNVAEKQLWQEMKQRLQMLLARLAGEEKLRHALSTLFTNPPLYYNGDQWQIIEALIHVLPKLAAELKIIFYEHQVSDFAEVAAEALAALGTEDNPTDLALYLDHKIHHLLIDEFQDTSIQQFNLLLKLTAGWQPHENRTLFLVGDPMQSIYRFRQAEVGLFLRARQQGVGNCALTSLTLSTNFRSTPPLVNWFNQIFPEFFPNLEDIALGAIRYTPCNPGITNVTVCSNSLASCSQLFADKSLETQHIISLLHKALIEQPSANIAILVRTRSQLINLLPALKQAKIPFNAVELEALNNQPIVNDLISLTYALTNLADRIAWLSILRAPWCGLTLHDLHKLTHHATKEFHLTIAHSLSQVEQYPLSEDGLRRVRFVAPILLEAIQNRSRGRLRDRIEQTWQALGGPSCLRSPQALQAVETFFDLLDTVEQGGELLDRDDFMQRIARCYLTTGNPLARVHLMTIHKAKGLQFDIVILPGLEQVSRTQDAALLLWLERQNAQGNTDLLLAPVKSAEATTDHIYQYIRQIDQQKYAFEHIRLFYVAATRAKQQLHLLATLAKDDDNTWSTPRKNSFLGLLWPQLETEFTNNYVVTENSEFPKNITNKILNSPKPIQRLPSSLFNSQPSGKIKSISNSQNNALLTNILNNPPNLAAIIGSLLHEELYLIAMNGIKNYPFNQLTQKESYWEQRFIAEDFDSTLIHHGIETIKTALQRVQHDIANHWIFSSDYQQSFCEYALSTVINNQVQTFIIDRTFIDDEGTHWIIDYKTSQPSADQTLETFLTQEKQRYAPQLLQYADVLRKLIINNRNAPPHIRLAIYFPSLSILSVYSSFSEKMVTEPSESL